MLEPNLAFLFLFAQLPGPLRHTIFYYMSNIYLYIFIMFWFALS